MSRLQIAVPNKGRLQQPTLELLRSAGLIFEKTDRALSVPIRNVEIDLLFVRTEDIPEMVQDGAAEMGITGIDLLDDLGAADVAVLAELGYGRCRLVAAVPEASPAMAVEDLAGMRIATAHPETAARFFATKSIEVSIVPLRGSVEVAPKLGVADAIVDLVSSGSTLKLNGLRPITTLLESQAVLVGGPAAVNGRSDDANAVATMVRAVVAGRSRRYVLMNAPAEAVAAIEDLIPGLESPTVVPLAHEGMVAVHSVVAADEVWHLLPKLEQTGASGILVLAVNQLIP